MTTELLTAPLEKPRPRRTATDLAGTVKDQGADAGVYQAVLDANDSALTALKDTETRASASHDQWVLDEATQTASDATKELTDAIAAAEQRLAEAQGQVDDNQIRQNLRDALDAAITVRDTKPANTVDAQKAQTTAATEHKAAVVAAVAGVDQPSRRVPTGLRLRRGLPQIGRCGAGCCTEGSLTQQGCHVRTSGAWIGGPSPSGDIGSVFLTGNSAGVPLAEQSHRKKVRSWLRSTRRVHGTSEC